MAEKICVVAVGVVAVIVLFGMIFFGLWYSQNHSEALLKLDVRAIASGGMISYNQIEGAFKSYGEPNHTKTPSFWFKNEGPDKVNVNVDFVDGDDTSMSEVVVLEPGEEGRVEHVFRYKKWLCRVIPTKP